MTKTVPLAETALAAVVVRHFLDMGAEVYQEVAMGSRADIVVKDGKVLHAIEVKTSCGLTVIEQAFGWREHAHRVSIAVPGYSRFAEVICRQFGIGVYVVTTTGSMYRPARVEERVRPAFRRRVSPRLLKALREEQKTFAPAGNNDGTFWSPRRAVAAALKETVTAKPGLTWRQAMASIRHHYSTDASAAGAFQRLVSDFPSVAQRLGLDWLHVTDDRPARLYVKGQEPQAPVQKEIA